jgi:hypothetical protein
MALFLVILRDVPDNAGIRSRLLAGHMEHIGRHMAAIRLAGPWLREAGGTPGGGLLVVEAEDAAAVRRMVEADPYFQAGLWEDVQVHPFRDLVNAWRSPPGGGAG